MAITKGDIVRQAYINLRISGLTSSATPEDTELGLQTLESMMLSWTNKGLNLGYAKSSDLTDPDPQDDSGLSDATYEAAYVNLACKLAPAFGKLPNELNRYARELYTGLFSVELPQSQNNPYMPLGGGDRFDAYSPTYQAQEDPITVENDGNLGDLTV
jgi:hypothetical protein